MKNNTYYPIIGLFLVSALLTTLVFNIKIYWYVLSLLESGEIKELSRTNQKSIFFGLHISAFHFFLFSLLAFFNYFWRDKLLVVNWPKFVVVMLLIGANLGIYLGWSYVETYWFDIHFDFGPKKFPPVYFLTSNFPVAVLGIAEAYILVLMRKVRMSEIEKTQLREEKAKAELAALKDQISPHFFFNTLSSLSTIVRNEKKETALEFIRELSNTHRYMLDSHRHDLVPLAQELNFVSSYLFLLRQRFGDKLNSNIEIGDALETKIPPMSLQMLVENAVKHNLMTQGCPLNICFFIENDMIVVENNLQEKKASDGLGLGLENLSNRYRLLTQQDIIIEKNEKTFKVKLPLLT